MSSFKFFCHFAFACFLFFSRILLLCVCWGCVCLQYFNYVDWKLFGGEQEGINSSYLNEPGSSHKNGQRTKGGFIKLNDHRIGNKHFKGWGEMHRFCWQISIIFFWFSTEIHSQNMSAQNSVPKNALTSPKNLWSDKRIRPLHLQVQPCHGARWIILKMWTY